MESKQERPQRVWGIVKKQNTTVHANIEILSIRMGGKWIYDSNLIAELFPPRGAVFGRSFFRSPSHQFHEYDCINFEPTENQQYEPSPNRHEWELAPNAVSPRREGWKVIDIGNAKIKGGFLDLSEDFEEDLKTEFTFYFLTDSTVLGPFKWQEDQIVPERGDDVGQWKASEIQLVKFESLYYIHEKPPTTTNRVDCSNPKQLVNWLERELKKHNSKAQIEFSGKPHLKAAILEMVESSKDSLFLTRIRRVESAIRSSEFDFENLKRFVEESETMQRQYQIYLDSIEAKIKEEFRAKNNDQVKELELLQIHIKEALDEKLKLETTKEALSEELHYLEQNRDRMVREFRMLVGIGGLESNAASRPKTTTYFQELIFDQRNLVHYPSGDEMIARIHEIQTMDGLKAKTRELQNFLWMLREHRGILIPDLRLVTSVAEAMGNAYVLLQQVEADWLKFDSLWNSGLARVLERATENPDQFHFLLLEDINMASPECWGKPLLDILQGQRKSIPIANMAWPKNLWLLGTKIHSKEPHAIGLPMYRQTFKNWGGMKRDIYIESKIALPSEPKFYLPFQSLWEWKMETDGNFNDVESYLDYDLDA